VTTASPFQRPAPAEDVITTAERRDAARALLRKPMLTDEADIDALRLVRRHRAELTRIFADGLGYRLQVEPSTARLFKAGLGRGGSRPLLRRSGAPFTPRAYAMLCLTIAALTKSKSQLLLDELVANVRSVAADAQLEVDLDAIGDRRALQAALMALVGFGVLAEREGDLEHWAERSDALSLLDVRRDRLALLVAAPLSACDSPDGLLDVAAVPSAAGGARVAIRRRLVESPVLCVEELTEEESEWWRRNRSREREWYRDAFGLVLELRAEGAIAIDVEDEVSDLLFPGPGSARQLALLLLERLTDRICDGDGAWRRVPLSAVCGEVAAVQAEWGRALRKDLRADPDAALREAADLLGGMGLVRIDEFGWLVHAAAARYRALPVLAESGPSGQPSLFDEEA
jgi:uncharacterized protein (TIGR02678 family)